MVYCLISLSPLACGYLSFAVAKATRQDASNPNVSSKKNPDTGRIPTTRNWTQLVWKDCDSHVGLWDGVKRACKLDGFIEPQSGSWRKETVRLWASSLMIKSTRGPRMIWDNFSSRWLLLLQQLMMLLLRRLMRAQSSPCLLLCHNAPARIAAR